MRERSQKKREARKAYVEYIREGGGMLVLFVFRGGWIDAIVMKRGLKGLGELVTWLRETGYFEEVSGIAFGEGFRGAIGGDLGEKNLGMPMVSLSPRNRCDAEAIIEGIRHWLIHDVEAQTDKLKSPTKV
ncbi:MAG: hypothetical protein N3D12_04060 [Candidatus Methanomethyliaceae archaeon]|nr:hypothetical protein [Candidatus Methanomethyliaceae archaeon]